MRSPEIIVVQLFIARRLKGVNVTSLRIHAGHDVLDHAILASGVHSLEDDQDRPAILRIEFLLQVVEHAFARIEYTLRVLFVFHPGRGSGIPVFQSKLLSLRNAKGFRQSRGLFDEFVVFHDFGSVVQTWRSEQRADSPAEGGEAVVGVEERIFGQGKESIHAQNI